jgi:hypothetical protein
VAEEESIVVPFPELALLFTKQVGANDLMEKGPHLEPYSISKHLRRLLRNCFCCGFDSCRSHKALTAQEKALAAQEEFTKRFELLEKVRQMLLDADADNQVEVFFRATHLFWKSLWYVINRLSVAMRVLLFAMYVGYVALVVIWWLLGAVLQPDKMLPFAAMVASYIAFMHAKVNVKSPSPSPALIL